MNSLQRILIEKAGNDNGFEHVVASDVSGAHIARYVMPIVCWLAW